MNPPHTGGSARLRSNATAEGAGHLNRRIIMARKFALMVATAAVVGGAAFIPAAASAGGYGYGYGNDIRSDRRDIQRDRQDLRRDYQELRRDLRTGRFGAVERELQDIRRDRQDLRRDYRDLRQDYYRRGY
jgi:hypothetical protein